jgi:hypothetical protein
MFSVYAMSFDELMAAEEKYEEKLAEATDPDQRRRIHARLRNIKARIHRIACNDNYNWERRG